MQPHWVGVVLGAGLLAACATPPRPVVAPPPPASAEAPPVTAPPPAPPPRSPSVFVLLPDPGGGSGAITVTNPAGAQEIRQPWHAVEVRGADQAPEAPAPLPEAEVRRRFAEALGAEPPEPVEATLYFREATNQLTPESVAALADLLRQVGGRRGTEVTVIGHTDTVGDRDANYRLGLQRAERVAELLRAGGLDPAVVDVRSHGESDLLVPTGDGVAEPRNRRVEIVVR